MSLWWLQPGWTSTTCARCGAKIWPEGDPDWGLCVSCFEEENNLPVEQTPRCDICKTGEAVAGVNGHSVCSQECADRAADMEPTAKPKETQR